MATNLSFREHKETKQLVAVKVLELDQPDEAVHDAIKENGILARLKDQKPRNVNLFIESLEFQSLLCFVFEYCSGGNLSTMRRPIGGKYEERYIRPIARELAIALCGVHKAGIVHRDVKCKAAISLRLCDAKRMRTGANVMVNENGDVQLIDFGVAGITPSNLPMDKRTTIIGTPHWMAPEMQRNEDKIPHSTEVDVWSYGITLYECATGLPPHAHAPQRQLKSLIRQAPKLLTDESYSAELRDLVKYVLEPDPNKRPTMEDVCKHPYISGTEGDIGLAEGKYPTRVLREIVEKFFLWQTAGGQRISLYHPGGAAGPEIPDYDDDEADGGWTFSTSENFKKRMSQMSLGEMKLSEAKPIMSEMNTSFKFPPTPEPTVADNLTLMSSPPEEFDDEMDRDLTARYVANEEDEEGPFSSDSAGNYGVNEVSAARGATRMAGIFDANVAPYNYRKGKSDLPLRSGEESSALHRQELSVSSNNGQPTINLESISVKKGQKRDTQAWTWAQGQEGVIEQQQFTAQVPDRSTRGSDFFGDFGGRPKLKHAATMPVTVEDHRGSRLDMDALYGDSSSFNMPSVQGSYTADHAFVSFGDSFINEPDAFEAAMGADPSFTLRPPTMTEPTQPLVQSDDAEGLNLAQSPPGTDGGDEESDEPREWQPIPPVRMLDTGLLPTQGMAPTSSYLRDVPPFNPGTASEEEDIPQSREELLGLVQEFHSALSYFADTFRNATQEQFELWRETFAGDSDENEDEDGGYMVGAGEEQAEAEDASGEGSGSA